MSNLLGGNSKQSQDSSGSSSNQAYPFLQQQFGSTTGQTADAGSLISSLLGVPGSNPATGQAGLNNYNNSTGMQFQLNQGTQAIDNNNASRGLLQSGATGKALEQYGTGLANQNFNSYLSNLFNLGNQGLQAGSVISGAGQQSSQNSNSSGKSKTGLGL